MCVSGGGKNLIISQTYYQMSLTKLSATDNKSKLRIL